MVGKTQVQAAGKMSLSAMLIHCNLRPRGSVAASPELLVGDVVGDGIALGQQSSVTAFEGGNLAKGELLEELCRLVGLAELEVLRDSQLGPAVLGSDLGLLSTEVVRVREQSPSNHACGCLPC